MRLFGHFTELLPISLKDTTFHRIMLRHHHFWCDSRHGILGIYMRFKESGATSLLYVNYSAYSLYIRVAQPFMHQFG